MPPVRKSSMQVSARIWTSSCAKERAAHPEPHLALRRTCATTCDFGTQSRKANIRLWKRTLFWFISAFVTQIAVCSNYRQILAQIWTVNSYFFKLLPATSCYFILLHDFMLLSVSISNGLFLFSD